MKHLVAGALALAVLGPGLAALAASTDLERFESKVGKYTMDGPSVASEQPKGLCVCQDGSDFHGYAGALQGYRVTDVDEFVAVRCWVHGFSAATGSVRTRYGCPTWVPLAK